MGAPTVDFDGITVSLRDADNRPIMSDMAGIGGHIIKVKQGKPFSVCVDFGEVSGSGPGMYSVKISLGGANEEEAYKSQSQTWCVTASFEGGVLQFKSFRLWNFTYENHTEQLFAMPKPGGHSPSSEHRGTIRVTIKRVTEEYRAVNFEPRPEIPDDFIDREDLAVGRDLYVANPYKLKPKEPTKHAKNHAEFVFRNTEAAYDSNEDEANTERNARRSSAVLRTPDTQGLRPRAAATEANRGLSGMATYQANLGRIFGQHDESRISPTQAYSENGIFLRRSKKNQHQHTSPTRARHAQPSAEREIDFGHEDEEEGKSDEKSSLAQLTDCHTPEPDPESSDEGLFVSPGKPHPPRTIQRRADSVISDEPAAENGFLRRSQSPNELTTPFIARESFVEVNDNVQTSIWGERKRKREESEEPEDIVVARPMRAIAPAESPRATMHEEPQRKTNVPRATAGSPFVDVERMEIDGHFDHAFPELTPSHHYDPFQEDATADLDTEMSSGLGAISREEQIPQSGTPPAMNLDSGENLLPVQLARLSIPPQADREDLFNMAIETGEEASAVKYNSKHTDEQQVQPQVQQPLQQPLQQQAQQQARQVTMGMAVAPPQPLANGTDPSLEERIRILALRITKTEAAMHHRKVCCKNYGYDLEEDERYSELDLEKASLVLEKALLEKE